MSKIKLIICLIFLVFTVNCERIDKEHEKISVFDTQYGKGKGKELSFYVVNLDDKDKTQNLIFTAQGITSDSEPQMFVTSELKVWPDSESTSEYYTQPQSLSLIYLNKKDIKSNMYTVGVKCSQECSFKFTAFHQDGINNMGMNDLRYIKVTEQYEHIAIDIKKENLNNFLAEFELMNPFEIQNTFTTYFQWENEDNEFPTNTKYRSSGRGWGSGNGMGLLAWTQNEICQNCTLRVTIEAKIGSIIRIESFAYDKEREIEPFSMVNDFTKQTLPKTFILNIDESKYAIDYKKMDLVFSLVLFQGDTDIYINQDFCPSKTEDFKWNSELFGDDRVVITPQERDVNNNKFCIRTTSEEYSMFVLNIFPLQMDKLILPFDHPESGTILKGEIINYKINIDGSSDFKVSINMAVLSGSAEIYVKECSEQLQNCQITSEEILKQKSYLKTSTDPNYSIIEFEHKGSECKKSEQILDQSIVSCNYAVAVYGSTKSVDGKIYDESQYVLLANHDYFQTNLVENRSYHDYVQAGDINYYKFNLQHAEAVTQLKFEVTGLHGEVTMFSSTYEEQPTIAKKDKSSFWNVITYEPAEGQELKSGYYFLGIQGDQPINSYTITVSVETSNQQQSYYKLQTNQPTSITLRNYNERAYFKFYVNPKNQEDIQVSVQRIQGKFHFYIAKNKEDLPQFDVDAYDLGQKSSHKQIIISSQTEHWSESGNYYGVIIPRKEDNSDDFIYKCKIQLNENNQKTLSLQDITQKHISTDEVQYYRLELFDHDTLSISKKVSKFDQTIVEMYYEITDNPEDVFPTKSKQYLQIHDYEPEIISNQAIQRGCKHLNKEKSTFGGSIQRCYIHISVYTTEETHFYLFADKNTDRIMLFPDIGQHLILQKNNELQGYTRNAYMYIQPNNQNVYFNFEKTSLNHTPKVHIKIHKLYDNQDKSEWEWPNPNSESFFGVDKKLNGLQTIKIQKYKLEENGCFDHSNNLPVKCVLLVSILDPYLQNQEEISTMEITANTGVRILEEGQYIRSSLDAKSIEYYEFTVYDEDVDEIIISASLFNNGQVTLLVQQGDISKPDINSKYYKKSRPEHPSISLKRENDETLEGTYIVGVYAESNSVYNLSFRQGGQQQFIYAKKSFPHELILERMNTSYILYKPTQNNDKYNSIRIITTELFGSLEISAIIVDFQSDFKSKIDRLFSGTTFTTPSFQTNINLLSISKQQIYDGCIGKEYCGIIIKATSYSYSRSTILIQDASDSQIYLPTNIIQNDFLKKSEFTQINFLSDQSLKVKSQIIKGEIKLTFKSDSQTVSKIISTVNSTYKDELKHYVQVNKYSSNTLTIQALEDSIFNIQAIPSGEDNVITYGLPHKIHFKRVKEIKKYIIHNNPDDYQGNIEINISHKLQKQQFMRNHQNTPAQISVNFYFESFKNPAGQQISTVEEMHFNENFVYVLPKIPEYGTITIELQLLHNSLGFNYFLTASESDYAQMIIPDLERRGTGTQGQSKIYELLIPEYSYVLLETQTCLGSTIFSTSTNYEYLKDGTSDLVPEIQVSHSGLEYQKINIQSNVDKIYIQANVQSQKAIYAVIPHIFNKRQKETPLSLVKRFEGGKEFKVKYQSSDVIKISVTGLWADVETLLENGFDIVTYHYQLYLSDSEVALDDVAMCKSRRGDQFLPKDYYVKEFTFTSEEVTEQKKEVKYIHLRIRDYMFPEDWKDEGLNQSFYYKVVGQVNVKNTYTNEYQVFHYPYDTYYVDIESLNYEYFIKWGFWSYFSLIIISLVVLAIIFKLIQRYQIVNKQDKNQNYGNLVTSTSFVE